MDEPAWLEEDEDDTWMLPGAFDDDDFIGRRPGVYAVPIANPDINEAARAGDMARLKFLVEEEGVNIINSDDWNATPLYYAALCGHTDAVLYLLSRGARCEPDMWDGERVFYAALHDGIRRILLRFAACNRARGPLFSLTFRLFNNTSLSGGRADFVLLVGSHRIHLHRAILAARSGYFRAALCPPHGKWASKKEVRLSNPGLHPDSPDALLAVLRWMYTERLVTAQHQLADVRRIARNLQLHELVAFLDARSAAEAAAAAAAEAAEAAAAAQAARAAAAALSVPLPARGGHRAHGAAMAVARVTAAQDRERERERDWMRDRREAAGSTAAAAAVESEAEADGDGGGAGGSSGGGRQLIALDLGASYKHGSFPAGALPAVVRSATAAAAASGGTSAAPHASEVQQQLRRIEQEQQEQDADDEEEEEDSEEEEEAAAATSSADAPVGAASSNRHAGGLRRDLFNYLLHGHSVSTDADDAAGHYSDSRHHTGIIPPEALTYDAASVWEGYGFFDPSTGASISSWGARRSVCDSSDNDGSLLRWQPSPGLAADVLLVCRGLPFPAHTAILLGRCKYFDGLLQFYSHREEAMATSGSSGAAATSSSRSHAMPIIPVDGVSPFLLTVVLEWLYADVVRPLPPDALPEALVTADAFMVTDGLKALLVSQAIGCLCHDNMCTLMSLGELYQLQRLVEACALYGALNLDDLLRFTGEAGAGAVDGAASGGGGGGADSGEEGSGGSSGSSLAHEFAELVRESAANIRGRQEYDSVPVLDEVKLALRQLAAGGGARAAEALQAKLAAVDTYAAGMGLKTRR